ncbi:MAG TPA: hypothetical protein VHD63_00015, partial [Ktedonobacteraceae bacterium]|nr:hypothetical protein [Ktedonobacteraceae bacterium]
AALQEGDIEIVLDVLAKAEQDAILEEMLWQIHAANLQEELDPPEASDLPAPARFPVATDELTEQRNEAPQVHPPRPFWRTSRVLQTLAAVLLVGALVGGFVLVLGGSHANRHGGNPAPPPFGCFVSSSAPQGQGWLMGMAAVADDDIWAVGDQPDDNGNGSIALIEHWNGRNWQSVANPGVSGKGGALNAVTALSATDVWAVGYITPSSSASGLIGQPLIEHWDGKSWRVVQNKSLSPQSFNGLTGVTAIAPDDIWAVGKVMQGPSPKHPSPSSQLLFEHWNGQDWQIVPGPGLDTDAVLVELDAVTALASDNIWAVGALNDMPFILHWNGQDWRTIASPRLSEPGGLTGISALDANNIWAVGSSGVIEHWDGKSWRVVVGVSQNNWQTVLALAPNDVWVGGASDKNLSEKALLEHWDGKSWQVITGPASLSGKLFSSNVNAITTAPSGKIWLVGFQGAFQNDLRPMIATSSCL